MRAPLLLLLLSCAGSSRPPQPASTATPATEEPPETEVANAEGPAESPPEPPPPTRVRFDLLRHPASTWRGNAEIVDFSSPAARRHTLGGWSTKLAHREIDGEWALVTEGRQGRLPFNWEREPATTSLHVEGRVIRAGVVEAYLNGERVGELTLPTTGWGRAEVALPASELRRGENVVLLRARGSRTVQGARVGVLLRRISVGDALPDEAAPHVENDRWVIPPGWRSGHAFSVPENARLIAEASADVRVVAITDEGRSDLGLHSGLIDVDLSAHADDILRLEFEAGTEPVSLASPRIVTPADENAVARQPENVLLVLVDTLRADRLAPINPQTRVRTPGLAAFAAGATTFTHAHAQENWTKPSVATLLSGLMPWEHTATQQGSVVPRSVELLPELLKEHGYATASFICNGYVSDRFGFRQGWDTYRNYIREGRRTRARDVAADVLSWLDGRPTDRPFFVYVHTIDPHVPYRPPREFLEMYGDADYSGPVNFRRDSTLLENVKLGRLRLAARDRAHLEALYDGEISYHDVHFRSILDGLERRGVADSTMVILTSDHGEEFWDHGSVGHGHSVYEELLHVPLFVRLPGEPPRRVTSAVGLVDVMPTILEALGKPIPAGLAGRSFLGELRGADVGAPRVTVSGFMDNWRTVTSDRWKLVMRPGNRIRLFDLRDDPREQNNVAAERPLTVRHLREELALRLESTRRSQRRRRHNSRTTTIDAETEAQLRALGYVTE
ncbi:MAG: sulfatase [Myxococcota bacterium]